MDRLLNRLERRLGRYAPSNITYWLVGLSGLVYLLLYAKPELAGDFVLDPQAVRAGEVWRLVTFLFMPWGGPGGGTLSLFLFFFVLMFLYTIGTSLEAEWGSFRFDVFYLLGALGTVASSLLFGSVTNEYLNLSLLLAFATVFPDYEIALFLVLPLKVKWLGLFDAALLVWTFATGPVSAKAGIVVALANYLLFCGPSLVRDLRGKALQGSRKQQRASLASFGPEAHKPRVCARCGKSDRDDANLEFRLCDCAEKCQGKLTEYCLEHARNH